jgi:predicted O-linked N-acetylglucosamine transferase (SPINDLY family)
MPELIANNIDEYISIAVDLAQDKDKLCKTRDGLRDRFAASPVMDQEKFTRNMEAAFREMWKNWVNKTN